MGSSLLQVSPPTHTSLADGLATLEPYGVLTLTLTLVASQKRPLNFGDKENKHNRTLLNIQSTDSKFKLDERTALILTEDIITEPAQTDLDSWLRQANPGVDMSQRTWQRSKIPFKIGDGKRALG